MLLGPQEPRFVSWPEAHSLEAARELCEFGESIGQPPDPWQRTSLRIGCGEKPDGTWAAIEVAVFVQRQNGKGGIVETRGLGGLFLLGERMIYYTAHNLDTTKLTFARHVDLVTNYDDLRRRVARVNKVNSEEAIELIGGAEYRFRTRGRGHGKGRGFTCETLFLDEALYLTQDAQDALLPTMLAMPNPQLWYLSTPPIEADAAIVKIRADGHAGVPGLAYAEWSNDPGADLDDLAVLASANPAYGIRLNERVWQLLRRRLGPEGFARECGGIWPRPPGAQWLVISETQWSDRLDTLSEIVGPLAVAVAVAPDRSWAAISSAGRREDGDRHCEVVDRRVGTGWVARRVAQLQARHEVCAVVVSRSAPESSLIVELEEAGIEVLALTAGQEAAAFGQFYDGVVPAGEVDQDDEVDEDGVPRDRTPIWHLDQVQLATELAGAGTRKAGGGKTWEPVAAGLDISALRSVTNAVYGFAATAGRGQKRTVLEGAIGV